MILSTLRTRWTSLLGTVVAVALGAALISGAAELLAGVGARDGIAQPLIHYPAAPIVVQGARSPDSSVSAPPPAGAAARLARVPGVAAAIPDVVFPDGRGWASARLAGARLVSGRTPASGEVVVGRERGVAVDGTVPVRGRPLRVSGLLDRPGLYVSDRDAASWGTVRAVGVLVAPNTSVDAVSAAISRALPGVVVRTGESRRLAEPSPEGQQLEDATALLGISAGLAGFVAIFVVASTFAFAVSQRRREFALMRLVGAQPRQVRRMVYAEAFVVGGFSAALGSVLGIPLSWLYAVLLDRAGLVPSSFSPVARFWPLTIGFGVGLVVALLGSWTAARRAGRVPAVEALRDAAVERRPMTVGRWFFGLLFLAGAVALIVASSQVGSEGAVAMTVFVGELFVVAFALLAPALIPPVIRLVSWPLARLRGAEPMLVRQGALTAVRRVASTAAPVLVTVGVAGSMIGAIATVADTTDADLRDRLIADVIVLPGSGTTDGAPEAIAAAVPGAVVSAPLATTIWEASPSEDSTHEITGDALGVDPATLRRTLDVAVVSGSLDDLRPGTMTVSDISDLHVGDTTPVLFADGTTQRLRVVAVVASLQSTSVLLPIATVRAHDPTATAPSVYVHGAPAVAVRAAVAPLGARAVDRRTYADSVRAQTDEGNQLALVALLGVALLYTGLAIVNTLLMATFDRRRELALLRLSGATPRQGLRVVVGEAALVVLVGTGLAVAATVLSLIGLAQALGRMVASAGPSIPWLPIGVAAAVCLVLAVVATALPARALLARPAVGAE
ncbi:ABC transporter permease [Cryptosporangium phraense]|uniref:FtsX-like permease family protein n=1 Tax=Cryptosporangium phraense TaxID=2593070 RepID=A0A545AHG4_9ACTN|nr:ABC transporter permease [Cryptosporangium phraense]TQS40759.1 FtsX-like permease family protein [Cryptosporangium phraense]